jgi:hypothetical protein
MITFLPYSDFKQSAQCLDYRRLGKQRLEAHQILRTLRKEIIGWPHHPATRMWAGYEGALWLYTIEIIGEWRSRGYKDSMLEKVSSLCPTVPGQLFPPWLGDENVHRSHRANLVRKDPGYYIPLFGNLAPEPYIWPV